jgi:hypothetical protein
MHFLTEHNRKAILKNQVTAVFMSAGIGEMKNTVEDAFERWQSSFKVDEIYLAAYTSAMQAYFLQRYFWPKRS